MELMYTFTHMYAHTYYIIYTKHIPIHTHATYMHRSTTIGYNEWILIIMVVIASLIFFIVPAILVSIFVPDAQHYSWLISAPVLAVIPGVMGYIAWRVNANRNAQRNFDLMNAATQPVTPESRPPPERVPQHASQSGNLKDISTEKNEETDIDVTTVPQMM